MEINLGYADNQGVRRVFVFLVLLILPAFTASAWHIQYAEEFYTLYHEHLQHYPDDTMEDIYYLQHAASAPFANDLYALALIKTPTDSERYKDLFRMHVYLKLVYSYLMLGSKWDKPNAYFYNAPWKQENIDNYNKAETIYKVAYTYWKQAQEWSAKAWALRDVHLDLISDWEDESFRIQTGDLDYKDTIDRTLAKLVEKRATFEKMDQTTY
jgi:hypothetical protein